MNFMFLLLSHLAEVFLMDFYRPPFHITAKMTALVAEIGEEIGRLTVKRSDKIDPKLRRKNRIRTIHSSLAIEHNSLSLVQVTAIIDGKRVLGPPVEIREVENAYEAYESLLHLDPSSVADLLKTHGLMMKGLIAESGRFRSKGVGIFDGEVLVHMAPPATFVPQHIRSLFDWYASSHLHPLLKSAVFHYEFEFIHPFADGNGRMGRLWHTLLLGHWKELFFWLPIEELIRSRQKEYYAALGKADATADCSCFVEFILELIRDSLREAALAENGTDQDTDQDADQDRAAGIDKSPTERLLAALGDETLSAAQIMQRLGLSHRPTFRQNYLQPALAQKLIERTIPDKPNSKDQRYKKCKDRFA